MTALIWDLDGTLLDSYGIIVDSVLAVAAERGVRLDRAGTHRELIAGSVKDFLASRFPGAPELWDRYRAVSAARDGEITLMPGAAGTLRALKEAGVRSFVYTHKGAAAPEVLRRLGVLEYFDCVLTAEAGLPRKPAPDGIEWLVRRYGLDKSRTFYIGDRPIDAKCAENAGVGCILYKPAGSPAEPTGTELITVPDLRNLPGEMESLISN